MWASVPFCHIVIFYFAGGHAPSCQQVQKIGWLIFFWQGMCQIMPLEMNGLAWSVLVPFSNMALQNHTNQWKIICHNQEAIVESISNQKTEDNIIFLHNFKNYMLNYSFKDIYETTTYILAIMF